MSSKIEKLKDYYKGNGLKETIKKVYRYASFKIKVKNPSKSNTVYKMSKKEKQIIKLKTNNRIYIFTNIPYFDVGGGQRAAQLAKTFNNMGYEVQYFYAFKSSETVKHTILLPTTEHKKISDVKKEEFEKYVNKKDIFIFEAPMDIFLRRSTKKVLRKIYDIGRNSKIVRKPIKRIFE